METPEKIALNVVIAGRKYKYNVDPEFEDLMRSAVNDVTDRLVALKSKYTFADNAFDRQKAFQSVTVPC